MTLSPATRVISDGTLNTSTVRLKVCVTPPAVKVKVYVPASTSEPGAKVTVPSLVSSVAQVGVEETSVNTVPEGYAPVRVYVPPAMMLRE